MKTTRLGTEIDCILLTSGSQIRAVSFGFFWKRVLYNLPLYECKLTDSVMHQGSLISPVHASSLRSSPRMSGPTIILNPHQLRHSNVKFHTPLSQRRRSMLRDFGGRVQSKSCNISSTLTLCFLWRLPVRSLLAQTEEDFDLFLFDSGLCKQMVFHLCKCPFVHRQTNTST